MTKSAIEKAQQVAIERHRRLHNAAIKREEKAIVDKYLDDIAAYVARAK